MKNFYFFGDSICFGQYISVEKTFVHKVAKWLNKTHENQYCVMNPSVIGNTTIDALNRVYYDVLLRKADIVYIQFGLNDCNIWTDRRGETRVSNNLFEQTLSELIYNCFAFKTGVILGTNHLTNKDRGYNGRNCFYNETIKNVGSRYAIPVIRHDETCKDNSHILPDGIHLSEAGHEMYFKNFKKALPKILKK